MKINDTAEHWKSRFHHLNNPPFLNMQICNKAVRVMLSEDIQLVNEMRKELDDTGATLVEHGEIDAARFILVVQEMLEHKVCPSSGPFKGRNYHFGSRFQVQNPTLHFTCRVLGRLYVVEPPHPSAFACFCPASHDPSQDWRFGRGLGKQEKLMHVLEQVCSFLVGLGFLGK